MKRFTSILAILLSALLVFSCDDDSNDSGKPNEQQGGSENQGGNENQSENQGNGEQQGSNQGALSVDWCRVTYARTPVTAGESFEVYSEVYAPGSTGRNGAHTGIRAQMGYIVADPSYLAADLSTVLGQVTWSDAVRNDMFNGAAVENHDEYMSTNVVAGNDGTYVVFYRYSTDDGATWTYCDGNGKAESVSIDALQFVIVSDGSSGNQGENEGGNQGGNEGGNQGGNQDGNTNSDASIGWCAVTWPDTHYGVTPRNFPPDTALGVYAQVYAERITGENGTHSGVTAQFGYLDTVNSSKTYADIQWSDAIYNEQFDRSQAQNNDEYMIAGEIKPPVGQYVAFYRFSLDNGSTWTVCDGVGILSSPEQLNFQNLVFFSVQ